MVFAHYDLLLQSGWKMNEIDDMDFLGYLDVLIWRAKQNVKPVLISELSYFKSTGVK